MKNEKTVANNAKCCILTYVDDNTVGWIAIQPREKYSRLSN